MTDISVTNLNKDKISEWLKFTYHANSTVFKKVFKSHQIAVTGDSDLIHLERHFKNGNPAILSICKGIKIDPADITANIKFVK